MRRFKFGIADSAKNIRGIVEGLTGEAREGVQELRGAIRRRRLL